MSVDYSNLILASKKDATSVQISSLKVVHETIPIESQKNQNLAIKFANESKRFPFNYTV